MKSFLSLFADAVAQKQAKRGPWDVCGDPGTLINGAAGS